MKITLKIFTSVCFHLNSVTATNDRADYEGNIIIYIIGKRIHQEEFCGLGSQESPPQFCVPLLRCGWLQRGCSVCCSHPSFWSHAVATVRNLQLLVGENNYRILDIVGEVFSFLKLFSFPSQMNVNYIFFSPHVSVLVEKCY